MKELKALPTYFLVALLLAALYFAFVIFKPYIAVIILAAIFASMFYPIYKWILEKTKGKESISALLTVIIFILVILIPLTNFVALLVKESIETYPLIEHKITSGDAQNVLGQTIAQVEVWQRQYLPFIEADAFDLRQILIDLGNSFTRFVVDNASEILNRTTQFFINLFFLLITMYYLLKDGKKFVERIMYLTPLPNKYDKKLFQKFQEVSKSTIVSTFVAAIVQGILAGIGFLIVGVPAFFLAVATGIASLIPMVGTALVVLPVIIILAIGGNWFGAIFLTIWAVVLIGLSDNLVRTKLIESKSNIHPLLVFFSIFGGLAAFGFLGFIFGPLILSICLTILHIYSLEFDNLLER